MRDARTNYIIVGGFVLAMLVALVVTVVMLTGRTGRFDSYRTVLPNVNGIKFGSRVTYEGFAIGQVEDMEPLKRDDGKTSFRLTLSVREGWQIPADSVARMTQVGILAPPTVDIRGGQSATMLAPGGTIPGAPAANIFATMNEMSGQLAQLNQEGLLPLMQTLNQQAATLGAVLEKQAPELMANLVAVTGDLAAKAPRITADVQKMTGTLSTQVLTEQNAERMAETIRNVAELSAGLQDSRKKLDTLLVGLDKAVDGNRGTVEASLKDLRHTLQAVARNIDSIAYNLDGTSRNFHEFSRQLRENPGVLLGGNKPREDGPGRR